MSGLTAGMHTARLVSGRMVCTCGEMWEPDPDDRLWFANWAHITFSDHVREAKNEAKS